MRVFVHTEPPPDRIQIVDGQKHTTVDQSQQYVLVFVDGSTVIRVFKDLYLSNTDVHFSVKNMEFFLDRMRQFRSLEYVAVKSECSSESFPQDLRRMFGAREGFRVPEKLGGMVEKYRRCSRDTAKGIEISFRPRMVESVSTSLQRPDVYLSGEKTCHRIFRILAEKKAGLAEIERELEDSRDDVQETLKSMVLHGLVVQKDGVFAASDAVVWRH